jgi:TMEM175 potassium channel family protein
MERDLSRIVAFTDGVMAVAITLLVLNIEVPQVASNEELVDRLDDLVPDLLAYALSFALVGRFWVIHHNFFETLRSFDATLRTLNLLFLGLIALVPFSTDLVDHYGDEPIAAAIFGATMGFAALTHWSMIAHTLRVKLVHDHRRPETEPFGSKAALAFSAIFFLSVPVAFVSTTAAAVMWVASIAARYPLTRARTST